MTFTSFLTFKAQLEALKVQLLLARDDHELALATENRLARMYKRPLRGGQIEVIEQEVRKLERAITAIETLQENLPQDRKPFLTP